MPSFPWRAGIPQQNFTDSRIIKLPQEPSKTALVLPEQVVFVRGPLELFLVEGELAPGEEWNFLLNVKGTYGIYCKYHLGPSEDDPGMHMPVST